MLLGVLMSFAIAYVLAKFFKVKPRGIKLYSWYILFFVGISLIVTIITYQIALKSFAIEHLGQNAEPNVEPGVVFRNFLIFGAAAFYVARSRFNKVARKALNSQ